MRRLLQSALLVSFALCGSLTAQVNSGNRSVMITPTDPSVPTLANVRRVNSAEAYRQQTAKKAVIVDVRSAGQFRLGHIKDAVNIPGSQLLGRIRELPVGRTIILYCA